MNTIWLSFGWVEPIVCSDYMTTLGSGRTSILGRFLLILSFPMIPLNLIVYHMNSPLGYFIFKAPVPNAPVTWIVNAFGMSSQSGFGIQQSNIEYSSVRPFYMNVEMPSVCLIGEQIGIRISIFNYLPYEIEVIVVLARSPHYKFVHVEPFGRVQVRPTIPLLQLFIY